MAQNNDDWKQKSYKICSDFLQGPWKFISIEEMEFSVVIGGLMNKLFHCSLPDSSSDQISTNKENIPKEVLVRFYGPLQENKDSLVRETTIFTVLSERNIGPKLYGVFHNGRIEQYLSAKSTSTWHDFSDLYIDVAKVMATFHSIQMPIKTRPPALEVYIKTWLEDVKNSLTINSPKEHYGIISTGEFEKEFNWVLTEVKNLGAKIVFCHNDMQGGNILVQNNQPKDLKKRVTFIDYEFSAYNYRGCDMAGYFLVKCFDFRPSEMSNTYKYNYNNFPTQDEQEQFVDAYLDQLQECNKEFENDLQKQKEKQKILEEISILQLGVCLYWVIFTRKAGLNPHNEFPFLEIGNEVWGMYKKLKEEFLSGKKFKAI